MTKKKTSREPKPKTAYELLDRVCRQIASEPKGYLQSIWLSRSRRKQRNAMGQETDCGTMACRAGWIVLLNDGFKTRIDTVSVGDRARSIIGATYESNTDAWCDSKELFSGWDCSGHVPGTRAYARAGVAGVRFFMAKHKDYLKARLLKGV